MGLGLILPWTKKRPFREARNKGIPGKAREDSSEFPDSELYFVDEIVENLKNISLLVKQKKPPGITIQEFKKRTENFFSSKDPEENLKNLNEMAQLFDEALAYAKKKREEKNVSHAHNVEERTVLNNFSQTMKPGVKTTLITKENEC